MADGTTKPIVQVQVGDQVLSRDPQTGKDEAKMVTATIERHAPVIVDVVLHDGKTGKAETLTCTPEHPLYVQGQGWVEAGSLGIGTSIVSRAGPALEVTGLTWQKNKSEELAAGTGSSFGGYTVYNLTIEDDHTFFVGTANGGTWVHNACANGGMFDEGELGGLSTPERRGDLRKNMEAEGPPPSDGMESHHELPWKLREWFADNDLNVNNLAYGKWVGADHQSWSNAYEQEWENFRASNPGAGQSEILDFLKALRNSGNYN